MPVERLRFAVDSTHQRIANAQKTGADVQAAIDDLVRFAKAADQGGVDSFWLNEDPEGWDAAAVLSVVARETERIRLGPGVMNPYYRHPALIAASLSTLDVLSDGRAFLGFGRGQAEWYREALGIDVGSPLRALEESFQLLRQWFSRPWHADAAEGATEFKVTHWERVIGPVQEHLPVYLAAVGPKALSIAARHADGVIFNELSSVTFIERTIRDVRDEAARHGRDADAMRFFARAAVTVTDDPEPVWERRKDTVSLIHALPGMERLLESPNFDTDEIIARVREEMKTLEVLERGGNFPELKREGDFRAARKHIPTELMQELVVAGPVEDVRGRLRRLREIGVTDVFLSRPKDASSEHIGEIVSALADA